MNEKLTGQEVHILKQLLQNSIEEVHYIFWENTAKKNQFYECLDHIQLLLDNGKSIYISSNEESDAISISEEFDLEQKQKELQEKFADKVHLRKTDVSTTDTWVGVLQIKTNAIDFAKDEAGAHIRKGFALQYDDCMIIVGLGEEGLYVELIEKDDEEI